VSQKQAGTARSVIRIIYGDVKKTAIESAKDAAVLGPQRRLMLMKVFQP